MLFPLQQARKAAVQLKAAGSRGTALCIALCMCAPTQAWPTVLKTGAPAVSNCDLTGCRSCPSTAGAGATQTPAASSMPTPRAPAAPRSMMAQLCPDAQLASGHCLCRCAHSPGCSLLCADGVGSRCVTHAQLRPVTSEKTGRAVGETILLTAAACHVVQCTC